MFAFELYSSKWMHMLLSFDLTWRRRWRITIRRLLTLFRKISNASSAVWHSSDIMHSSKVLCATKMITLACWYPNCMFLQKLRVESEFWKPWRPRRRIEIEIKYSLHQDMNEEFRKYVNSHILRPCINLHHVFKQLYRAVSIFGSTEFLIKLSINLHPMTFIIIFILRLWFWLYFRLRLRLRFRLWLFFLSLLCIGRRRRVSEIKQRRANVSFKERKQS